MKSELSVRECQAQTGTNVSSFAAETDYEHRMPPRKSNQRTNPRRKKKKTVIQRKKEKEKESVCPTLNRKKKNTHTHTRHRQAKLLVDHSRPSPLSQRLTPLWPKTTADIRITTSRRPVTQLATCSSQFVADLFPRHFTISD